MLILLLIHACLALPKPTDEDFGKVAHAGCQHTDECCLWEFNDWVHEREASWKWRDYLLPSFLHEPSAWWWVESSDAIPYGNHQVSFYCNDQRWRLATALLPGETQQRGLYTMICQDGREVMMMWTKRYDGSWTTKAWCKEPVEEDELRIVEPGQTRCVLWTNEDTAEDSKHIMVQAGIVGDKFLLEGASGGFGPRRPVGSPWLKKWHTVVYRNPTWDKKDSWFTRPEVERQYMFCLHVNWDSNRHESVRIVMFSLDLKALDLVWQEQQKLRREKEQKRVPIESGWK